MSDKRRKATEIVRGERAVDGAGVRLTRVLGIRNVKSFDPFLMLDGFDSYDPSDYIKGFPWHPHRGIETLTYLLEGEMVHGDSLGNEGTITSGGAQWMSAGSGIIHQEMPQPSEHMLGCQLWINLPQEYKMSAPSYGDIVAKDVPVVEEDNATVRVISGEYKGTVGSFRPLYVQVTFLDVDLKPGETFEYRGVPNNETLFSYLYSGEIAVNEQLNEMEGKGCAVLFSASNEHANEYETVCIKAGDDGARFALLAGKPLREPVAWGGPIVMNTREELEQAFDEMERGVFIK